MAPSFRLDFNRSALRAANRCALHEARNQTKAIVSLVEWPPGSDETIVVKDLAPRALWFRLVLGRWLLWREWKALEFLTGTAGVPVPLARVDADAFAMQQCAGESLLRFAPGELPASAIVALERIVVQMHERGVTHGDLHRDNILLDGNGQVSVIDWATSCVFGPHRRGFKTRMWGEWKALDSRALAKLKARYAPELLRPDERELLEGGGTWLSRAVRRVGALFKKRATLSHPKARSARSEGGWSQHV